MCKFAICIYAGEDVLLTARKIYQVLPDEKAERSDYIRIIEDEGEDYLYPKKYFVFAPFPQEVEKSLLQTL
ncbi:MAG: hypothetical protein H0X72_15505 [Acidobacteria bacterium]|jgi:hypothetical protein|nr:hypothetical protein [Acidobacteriota bacterium]